MLLRYDARVDKFLRRPTRYFSGERFNPLCSKWIGIDKQTQSVATRVLTGAESAMSCLRIRTRARVDAIGLDSSRLLMIIRDGLKVSILVVDLVA